MKIFISHASANKEYGNALVDLLRGIGIKEEEIVFTSNIAYGIPIGQNIFNWLRSQISEKPFVIYLLSKEYYSSIACLNEMGAAWIIENEHAMLFTPNFDISSKEFQNGAIDPREIGFFINDEERILNFIQHLETYFSISKNSIIVNQKLKKYLGEVNSILPQKKIVITENKNIKEFEIIPIISIQKNEIQKNEIQKNIETEVSTYKPPNSLSKTSYVGIYQKFIGEISLGKLKDEELILLNYIIETSRIKLFTGWQEDYEIKNIKEWEEINDFNNTLSNNYSSVIRKFELRGYTEFSAFTSSNNPKEVTLKSEITTNILDLPEEVLATINKATEKNKKPELEDEVDDLPF